MQAEIDQSVAYLSSPEARESFKHNIYWPKWNSPWWHMMVLHEMGETKQIPKVAVDDMVRGLQASAVKIFPTRNSDIPPGLDMRDTHCHCGLGNMYQVLAAWGVSVDEALPWIRPWFFRYQREDGGLNCDSASYLVTDECPTSMVGTIAPFEAVLHYTNRAYTPAEKTFLDRAAAFLIARQLRRGSSTKHNAEERDSESLWLKPCFPRFYLYDVLRGLHALLSWSDKTKQPLPADAVSSVVDELKRRFPDGQIRNERHAYDGISTPVRKSSGEWVRHQPASFFPLLEKVSRLGEVSPYLSRHWAECQRLLDKVS